MESNSSTLYLENERMMLVEEVNDMKNLSGIMEMSPTQLMSTTSLKEYPRKMNLTWEKTMDQGTKVNLNRKAEWENGDDQTRSRESMSLKCHGLVKNNRSGSPIRTLVATKPKTLLTSSNEIQSLSRDGSDVHLAPQQDSLPQNGMRSLKEKPSTLIPSSVLSITSAALTKALDILDLLRSSLGDQNQL